MNGDKYILEQLEKEEKFKKLNEKDIGVTNESDGDRISKVVIEVTMDIILALLTLFIIGLSELFSPDWNWGIYLSATFWISYGLVQTASWFSRIWIFITRIKHHEETDKDFIELENKTQEFINIDFEEPFIEEEANEDNFERKKRAWINKQKRKILKISNKHHITNVLPYIKEIEFGLLQEKDFVMNSDKEIVKTWELDLFWKHRKNRWLKKQKRINSKLNRIFKKITKEWCDTNLETVKIHYNKVSRTILCNGYTSNKDDSNTPDYKKNSTKIFLRATLPTFMFISIIMFIIVPLRAQMNDTASAWFQFLIKFSMVFISGALMWFSSKSLFNQTSKKAQSERVSTLNKYFKKHINKKGLI